MAVRASLAEDQAADLLLYLSAASRAGKSSCRRSSAVRLACAVEKTKGVVSAVPAGMDLPVIDAVAALTPGGDMAVSIVHRGVRGPVDVELWIEGAAGRTAEVFTLAARRPWDANTPAKPGLISPRRSVRKVGDRGLKLRLASCSVTQVRIGGR